MDDNKKLPDSYWEAFLFTLPKAQPCSYKSHPGILFSYGKKLSANRQKKGVLKFANALLNGN